MDKRQIHLDFHTSRLIEGIGSEFSAETFSKMLRDTEANLITCFAKCHHGNLYYETELDEKHPHLDHDLLTTQYTVTRQLGVTMPVYISVGFDEHQAQRHPEWISRDSEGKQIKEFGDHPFDSGWHWLCLNNDYVLKIEEVIADVFEKYKNVDGFFFDIVTQPNCCCPNCIEGMHKHNMDPLIESERYHYAKLVENSFKDRISQYIHSFQESASVFYNGLVWNTLFDQSLDSYTHVEIESLASGVWGYDHYPLVAKFIKHYGLETVAMTGRFHKSWADFGGYKTDAAIEFESIRGAVLSNAVSIGDQLHPSGRIDKKAVDVIKKGFTAALPYFQETRRKDVHDVAILIDKDSADLFSSSVAGASRMLRESHILYDIISVNSLSDEYKVVILPDTLHLDDHGSDLLQRYVDDGGQILATYKSGLDTIIKPVTFEESEYNQDYIESDETLHIAYSSGLKVELDDSYVKELPLHDPYFNRTYKHFSSHFQTPPEQVSGYFGRFVSHQISYLSHPYFSLYYNHGNEMYRSIVIETLEKKLNKTLNIQAPLSVYVEAQEDEDAYYLSFMNYVPIKKGTVFTIDTALETSKVSVEYKGETFVVPTFEGNTQLKILK